jgi:RNA polymerase sigma factor (sigma-70 family)
MNVFETDRAEAVPQVETLGHDGVVTRVDRLPDVESYAMVYRREYPRLVAVAWGLTGSRETAEDLAQEALLALHRQWDDISRIENPGAYVRRTCSNLAVSQVRRRVAEAKALLRLNARPVVDAGVDEDAEAFWAEVRRLPRRQAQAVALFYGYDLSVEDVADTLQVAQGTVKAHLHAARATLAARMGTTAEPGSEAR